MIPILNTQERLKYTFIDPRGKIYYKGKSLYNCWICS